MKELHLHLENCYGIRKMKAKFKFGDQKVQLIYAANGTMKTSLAKTFGDYSRGEDSGDLIYPEREAKRVIADESGKPIDPSSVFVIRPYDAQFRSEGVALLLANERLRNRYENVHQEVDQRKQELLVRLRTNSGLRKEQLEKEFCSAFMKEETDFYTCLQSCQKDVLGGNPAHLSHIVYSKIFDEAVVAFLESGDVQTQIREYIQKYDELINKSRFLQRGFNHYNAHTVLNNLRNHGFFTAKHTVNLTGPDTALLIRNETEFAEVLEEEFNAIFEDAELQAIFESINDKITNKKLRDFREFLFEQQEILPLLADLDGLKKRLWVSYLQDNKEYYIAFLQTYQDAQSALNEIVVSARKERTKWETVLDVFHSRFFVPFRVRIKNKADAVLKTGVPSFYYDFHDEEDIQEELLFRVLSRGEQRAFYLMNIIFEIRSRQENGLETLLIVDDIADSFDYQNKFAIIEYLKELAEHPTLKMIIMTHNFDFFRTAQSRICPSLKWEGSFLAQRLNGHIHLEPAKFKEVNNPFESWKKDFEDPVKLVASIPFARNIAQYLGDAASFKKLTSLLHIKPDSYDLIIGDLARIYDKLFIDKVKFELSLQKRVLDLIFDQADILVMHSLERGINLEKKIVLSMAIRLKAEEYMISEINQPEVTSKIDSNQTGELFGQFKRMFPKREKEIRVLNRVSLATPENIHINSFMFEPIIDMSDEYLQSLYREISELMGRKV
ncbi:MAG: hypothetical protein GX335_03810 [Firmicutes bacterium]|nr:hypothetical protein [Bacillota bacterium]